MLKTPSFVVLLVPNPKTAKTSRTETVKHFWEFHSPQHNLQTGLPTKIVAPHLVLVLPISPNHNFYCFQRGDVQKQKNTSLQQKSFWNITLVHEDAKHKKKQPPPPQKKRMERPQHKKQERKQRQKKKREKWRKKERTSEKWKRK